MTDNSSAPVDLRIKRKRIDIDDGRSYSKKKSRQTDNENPLDLSVKSNYHSTPYPMPLYNPANLFLNSSALLYDLFLANLNSYCQQQPQVQQTQRVKIESKSVKQSSSSPRTQKDQLPIGKHESYACSCGERYTNVAQLVSHLKITNHSAQLSTTHDEVAKLVRGQDIWLSRDTNPANQILKCLRCSLSFETLPDLTAHMMKTNHFTQPLSSSSSTTTATPSNSHSNLKQHSPVKFMSNQSRSTCLVCSQQFSREVDLVDHLQRLHQIRFNCTTCGMYFENENIYKEHLIKEMHHRNGKFSRHRDFLVPKKTKPTKYQSSIDRDVERVLNDLLDRIVTKDESTNGNALSLLQNFVIQQTPSTNNLQQELDFNNNFDDENSNNLSTQNSNKSNESPLVSLEKMLAYSTTIQQPLVHHGIKKKQFDKYRLFAEKMLRSTFS